MAGSGGSTTTSRTSGALRGSDDAKKRSSKNDLQFINLDGTTISKTKTTGYRKQVRSHVTSQQHRKAREIRLARLISTDIEVADVHKTAPTALPRRRGGQGQCHKRKQVALKKEDAAALKKDATQPCNLQLISYHDHPRQGRRLQDHQDAGSHDLSAAFDRYLNFSKGKTAFQRFVLQDEENVVGTSLHQLNVDLSLALSCYEYIVSVQSRELDKIDSMPVTTTTPNSVIFLRLIFSDPCSAIASMIVTVLYLTAGRRHSNQTLWHPILRLRGLLFRAINAALDEPSRALSEPCMIAVALSAAFELEYDPTMQSYRTQMDGLMLMISLRGGLSKIGETDPRAEHFYLWHIANTAKISGYGQYYEAACGMSSVPGRLEANARSFRMKHEQRSM